MANAAEQWVTVATGLSESRVSELALVLTAREIPFQRQAEPRGWQLLVPLANAPGAAAELTLYWHENAREVGPRVLATIGDGSRGVYAYAAVLLAVFVALHADLLNRDWLQAGRLQAGALMAGQWWRAVTALTVHIELAHLGGNLAFGTFFGYFVGRYLGNGVGWSAVLLSAAGANVLNALAQGAEHRSIGASTAVFAALGLLVAYTWRRGFLRETPWRARIAPIVAGLGLLAFTGTAGDNTDLGAHFFGFVMGFASGVLLARAAIDRWLHSGRVQSASAAGALSLVLLAWLSALT